MLALLAMDLFDSQNTERTASVALANEEAGPSGRQEYQRQYYLRRTRPRRQAAAEARVLNAAGKPVLTYFW